ncbi:MAG: glycosyltransferase family 4 protein, partial [Rhodospirillales bacterium]|nr:glycosyltransferase family 4 protein [Rhodospirillales bacterium]
MLRQLLSKLPPELIVTMLAGSPSVVAQGNKFKVPTILRVVGPDTDEGMPPLEETTIILANSPATAQLCETRYGRKTPYVLELVNHDDYTCEREPPGSVTFVNPRLKKGLELVTEVARRLLHIPFLIVHGWSRSEYVPAEARAIEFLSELPNVRQYSKMSEMRDVYAQTRMLLVPSKWPESWARVIGEAQSSGIPVLVSDRGSSPLQVGQGGVVLPYGNIELWCKTIERLWRDQSAYSELE